MLITNFSAGELSENLNGRIDLQQYYQAASQMENFEIIPTGGIKRRVGTQRLAKIDSNSRLIPFILDKDNVFVFQCYAFTINIWRLQPNGILENVQTITFTQAQTQPTAITFNNNRWYKFVDGNYVFATSYEEGITYYYNYADYSSLAEIREIQYAQNYDTIILCHRNHRPTIIQYNFTTNLFDISYMHFDFSPDVEIDDDFDFVMLPVDYLPTCIKTPTANGYYEFTYSVYNGTSTVVVNKSYAEGVLDVYCVLESILYKYDSVNSWIVVGNDSNIDITQFTVETKYPGCCTFFNNRLFFASSISKRQKIWASAAPDTENTRYNDFSTYKKYVTVNKAIKDADLHLFTTDIAAADVDIVNHRTTLRNVTQNFTISGSTQKPITNYFISNDNIPVGVKVISCTENTIVINTDQISVPETGLNNLVCSIQLWRDASNPSADDYEYKIVSNNVVTADCSFNFELASDENDAIMFLSSNKFLAVGTESSIWSIAAGVNATSIIAEMQGRFGSDRIQGQTVGNATIYFSQGNKGIREYYYDSMSEGFTTNNIAILADQMLRESSVVDFDYKTNPFNRLIITRQDKKIVTLLYDKNNGVMGWNRWTRTQGGFNSVAVTRGSDESDLIFAVVQDGENYFIELLDETQQVYLDSWEIYNSENISDYDVTKAILHNVTTDRICSANNIPEDFINEGDVVYIGYRFISYIKSMPVITNDPVAKKRIVSLQVRFLNSFMPRVKVSNLPDELFYGVAVPFSGVKDVTYPGSSDNDVYFTLETEDVYPVNILSVNAKTA